MTEDGAGRAHGAGAPLTNGSGCGTSATRKSPGRGSRPRKSAHPQEHSHYRRGFVCTQLPAGRQALSKNLILRFTFFFFFFSGAHHREGRDVTFWGCEKSSTFGPENVTVTFRQPAPKWRTINFSRVVGRVFLFELLITRRSLGGWWATEGTVVTWHHEHMDSTGGSTVFPCTFQSSLVRNRKVLIKC